MPFPGDVAEQECNMQCQEAQATGRDIQTTAGGIAAGVGVGYVVWRCARMTPSLVFPPLWPTIPANAIVP